MGCFRADIVSVLQRDTLSNIDFDEDKNRRSRFAANKLAGVGRRSALAVFLKAMTVLDLEIFSLSHSTAFSFAGGGAAVPFPCCSLSRSTQVTYRRLRRMPSG